MNKMKIKPKIVDQKNFQKFGKLVRAQTTEPTSQAADYKFWSNIASYSIPGETEIGICTVYKQSRNELSGMERHLNTPEILIPIDAPFVLPLLCEDDTEEAIEAFTVDIGEAVVIRDGIWHGACLPVGKEQASYFVIFRKGTPFEDVQKKEISKTEIEV